MALQTIQAIALCTGIIFMLSQLLIAKKETAHILFAIFCGSVAISIAKDMSGDAIGAYKYLIGMAACATCNCYWLLSRSLFREKKSISVHHLLLAVFIAALIMLNQGFLFFSSSEIIISTTGSLAHHALREITILLSSCILVLSFWEGCRGFSIADQQEKAKRLLFLATFSGAVAISKLTSAIYSADAATQQLATTYIILFVLISTQILIFWHFNLGKQKESNKIVSEAVKHEAVSEIAAVKQADESALAAHVKVLIDDQRLYLQPHLKIADVARKLDVPEYRVSNALRYHLNARNFNQYINEFRIKHAQSLLTDIDTHQWPVLVIGMESGFASVGPFTRAFKTMTGYTPNQYRQKFSRPKSA